MLIRMGLCMRIQVVPLCTGIHVIDVGGSGGGGGGGGGEQNH